MGPHNDLLDETQHTFERYAGLHLTSEEARECQVNIAGFFRLLAEWQHNADNRSSSHKSAFTGSCDSAFTPASLETRDSIPAH